VKQGGVLVYCGRDDDPYQSVMEWWNTGSNKYSAPSQHLFELLQIKPTDKSQEAVVGKGKVYILRQNPKVFVMESNGDEDYMRIIKKAYQTDAKEGELQLKNNFYLQRGPYDIVSVMDESTNAQPYTVNGLVVDLFDPELPVLPEKIVNPGHQAFLYNISRIKNKKQPQVLASACRVYDQKTGAKSYSFVCKSPLNTVNRMRILLPANPKKISVTNDKKESLPDIKKEWDAASHTLLLGFNNSPEGITVEISW
jgi:hypothetical protein